MKKSSPRLPDKVRADALSLPPAQRADLAAALLLSLEDEPDEPQEVVEAAWQAEIQRRLEEIDQGRVKTIPWEDVKEGLLRRKRR